MHFNQNQDHVAKYDQYTGNQSNWCETIQKSKRIQTVLYLSQHLPLKPIYLNQACQTKLYNYNLKPVTTTYPTTETGIYISRYIRNNLAYTWNQVK